MGAYRAYAHAHAQWKLEKTHGGLLVEDYLHALFLWVTDERIQ